MTEKKGNLFTWGKNLYGKKARVITTNGFLKKNGQVVMDAGVAQQAARRHPTMPSLLGSLVRDFGNHVFLFWAYSDEHFISFPVKYNWWEDADLELIDRSCQELVAVVDRELYDLVMLPRPGCGNGKLSWQDVKPVLESHLDDRFIIVNPNTNG